MATKSTKFKYTNPSKAICLLLAALLFALGTWCAVELGAGVLVFGGDDYFKGSAAAGKQSYTESRVFEQVLQNDLSSLNTLASKNETAYSRALAGKQEETVEEIVDQYMTRQKYLKQQKQDPEEEPFARSPEVYLLFGEDDYTMTIDFEYENMALSEEAIRKELDRQYDLWEESRLESYRSDRNAAQQWLSANESLFYYVRSADGTVYTNQSKKPSLAEVKQHKVFAVKNAKVNEVRGIDYLDAQYESGTPTLFEDTDDDVLVSFYLDDALASEEKLYRPGGSSFFRTVFEGEDEYIATRQMYDAMKDRPAGWVLTIMIVSYLAGLALLLWFLHLTGHVNDDRAIYAGDGSPEPVTYAKDGSRLVYAAIDRLPGDLHFLISAALFGVCLGLPIAAMADASGNFSLWKYFPLAGAGATFLCVLLLAEWLASVCRTVKSGRGFWKNTLIWRILRWFGRICKAIGDYAKEAWHLTKYTPEQLPKHAFWIAVGYVLGNILLVNLMHGLDRGFFGVLFFLLFAGLNALVLIRITRYLKGLDEIIAASEEGAEMPADRNDLPVSLKTLAANMEVSRERIDRAVEKAVKEEQTRTELITNVTHDLKTPLTSLINYSDLLDRKAGSKELGDEESVKYVGVIHDQSEKLKRLIDDLLEASKASAGNVQLNCSNLNLTELAAQAIAEFAPEMAKNRNEVVFVDGSGQPASAAHMVYADGTKTYRILSNLLSNAQKYSAPGTRVYATVSDGPATAGSDGTPGTSRTTVFELKNTSAAPLNISAEELMARFVRGDRSRGETEGNGLGLSIARDLTSLMGGTLVLDIDGDLFKATVTLPKQKI